MNQPDEAAQLLAEAQRAAMLRAHRTDPSVVALTIEQTRDRLDRWGWTLLFIGLAFTTVNVHDFVAGPALVLSLPWSAAWLIEPMVMGLMLVLIRGEQIANRYQHEAGKWVRWTRWIALGVTYVMNTGHYWAAWDWSGIFIHSVPVVLVFLASEALVQQRLTLTSVVEQVERVHRALTPIVQPEIPSRVFEASGRRPADLVSLSDQNPVVGEQAPVVSEVPPRVGDADTEELPVPEAAPEGADEPAASTPPASGRRARGEVKEALWRAFQELAEHTDYRFIRPVDVDECAGLPKGTAKRRIDVLRTQYAKEVTGGTRHEASA